MSQARARRRARSQPMAQSVEARAVAVGPWDAPDFAAAKELAANWPRYDTLETAAAAIRSNSNRPDVIVLAQPRPDCYAQADIDRLQRLVPLVRVIVVAGAWCEGQWRTGKPIRGAVHLYVHEFAAWWRYAVRGLAEGKAPPWSAPLDEPRAGGQIDPRGFRAFHSENTSGAARCLAVVSRDFAVFSAVAAGLSPYGWACSWTRGDTHSDDPGDPSLGPVRAAIFDGGQLGPDELERLAAFCTQGALRGAPVIVLADFPRAEHVAAVQAVGAAAVIGKPYQLPLVASELERLAIGPA